MVDQIYAHVMSAGQYVLPFIIVLSVVVFVHEFGHFWVARRCGVKIEAFSIGFGPQLFGWTDKYGTLWRVACLPLGGYVKMFGDADPSSFGPGEDVQKMTEEEKKVAFYSQNLKKRLAIVAAGPGSNYLFAILLLAFIYLVNGQPYTPTVVNSVLENSAAAAAGMKPGDKVMSIDGVVMPNFESIRRVVGLNVGVPMDILFERDGAQQHISVAPEIVKQTDRFGMEHNQARLGISSTQIEYRKLGILESIRESFAEAWKITSGTLKGVGQMVMGVRGTDELGGPLRIAEMSGKVAKDGTFALLWFIVVISVNLGLINLFPIPLLDGGHLLFYFAEGLRGRPLSERAQDYGAKFGALVVMCLMVFATWNDLVHLRVFSYLRGLFS